MYILSVSTVPNDYYHKGGVRMFLRIIYCSIYWHGSYLACKSQAAKRLLLSLISIPDMFMNLLKK